MLTLILFFVITVITLTQIFHPVWYWKKRGVFYSFPFFDFLKTMFSKKHSVVDVFIKMYNDHSHLRYFGTNFFGKPALCVCDVNLVKQILITDNDNFSDHFDFFNGTADLFMGSALIALKGSEWKNLRNLMSPLFTTSKLKATFKEVTHQAKLYVDALETDQNGNKITERHLGEFYGKYTTDIILNFACGISDNSLQLENYGVYNIVESCINPNAFVTAKVILGAMFPKLFQFFRIPVFSPQITKTFFDLIKKVIDSRQNNIVFRSDLIQHLLEARKQQKNNQQPKYLSKSNCSNENQIPLSDETIVAQVFLFCIAGSGTSSATLSFLTYELALNPKVQQKLQKEIDNVMEKSQNQTVNYEDLLNMKYLEQVINETLRKWSPSYAVNRICKEDYIIEPVNSNEKEIVIEKGNYVVFSSLGLHYNPKLFPEPKKFDPERFNDENKHKIVTGSYLPFLIGGRNCIGSRFAMLQMKIIIFYLLHKYTFLPVEKTEIPMILGNRLTTESHKGIYVGFKKRF